MSIRDLRFTISRPELVALMHRVNNRQIKIEVVIELRKQPVSQEGKTFRR